MRRSYACLAGLLSLGVGGAACAQVAGGDPAGSSPITGALLWIQGTLLGNLATTAAVIAVAVVGLLMLTGRMDWKRGLTVILGAFILFGAASIVAGIRSAAGLHT
ncbi:MAG: type secretion protein [Caulobacteraceae bacterium]|nr:type secretion protein [Caulobacteraceae bacterium]